MAANRYFKLDGRYYEVVAKAEDQSHLNLGQIVIYREPNSNTFLCMPRAELKAKIQMQNVDWNNRLDLYKERFVGRTDIYAKRLIAKDTGKKYYVVDGPFEGGHLSKTNHYPLTDRVLMRHLSAQDSFAIGLYPMVKDNTTPFLALDIDGHSANQSWKELTSSLEKVCGQYQVPYLTELSQSGKGSHVWLFFKQPLQASKARQLGDALLQATQSVDPRLPFTAFDRLFPAQDRIGGKQFGNLIAAPLEGKAMLEQRGVFVDHQWQPFENQWMALKRVELLDELQVDATIKKIQSRVGYQLFDNQSPTSDDLFEAVTTIASPLHVTRANVLYIEKSTLTQQELLQLKRLASFHNPQFYEAQNNRLSVHNIPRIITLFQESKQYLSIPRGLEDEVRGIAIKTVWEDKTIQGSPLHAVFNGELRPNQQAAYQALLSHQNGILSARTGFGKTVIAARLIAKRAVSTLILVKNKTLAEQWHQRLTTFLRIDDNPVITELTPSGRQRRKKVIGSYYGSKKNRSGLVDIATTQSLSRLKPEELTQFLAAYGMVISDEVHHDSASTFDAVIQQISSRYLYGLSATPYRRDGHEPIIMMRFGPIRYHTEAIDPVYAKTVHRVVIPRFTNLGMTNLEMLNNGRTENNQAIMNDPQRDKMVIRDCKNALKENRHTIVLTNLVAHVDQLYNQLPEEQTFRIYGGFSAKQRAEEVQKIESYVGPYVILATVSTAGEGLDVPTLDTLILTMPIGYRGNVEQVVGRLHRDLAHKSELRIYDYVDMFVPMMMRMYRKRRKAYKHLEYEISEDQYSRQKGLQVFDGHYQVALSAGIKEATQLLIVAPKLKSYLKQLVQLVINAGGEVQVYTQTKRDESFGEKVKWNQSEHSLPNCVIIDERQLWFSADAGFGYDRGMTVRLDHPELIQNFKKMLIQTMSEF